MFEPEYEAIQTHDDQSTDLTLARFVATVAPTFQSGQFVIINDNASKRKFFGIVAGPNRNFNRDSLTPFDSSTINQLERLLVDRTDRDVVVNEFYVYDIVLIRDISNGAASSVRRRPQIGSIARFATENEITNYLGLPNVYPETKIGMLMDTDIPLCVSESVILHHKLVAGSTGSGKSNVISNDILAAVNLDFAVIMLDHKPDYQNIHEFNDEDGTEYQHPIDSYSYWHIGRPSKNLQEASIYVRACELDPEMLAATIFYQKSENNQREEFQRVVQEYTDANPVWEWSQLMEHLMEDRAWGEINRNTRSSAKSRLKRPGRVPPWIDDRKQPKQTYMSDFLSGHKSKEMKTFDVTDLVRPGHVSVIRVGGRGEKGRDYGLFLSYIQNKVADYRTNNLDTTPNVMISIDEAQDIFCGDDALRNIAVGILEGHVRTGRSVGIGYVIGVQSADSVPDNIMQNLTTRIILRHNEVQMIKNAMSSATESQRNMTNTFGPGEALVQMHGAISIVHAKMRRSPFKLTKTKGNR